MALSGTHSQLPSAGGDYEAAVDTLDANEGASLAMFHSEDQLLSYPPEPEDGELPVEMSSTSSRGPRTNTDQSQYAGAVSHSPSPSDLTADLSAASEVEECVRHNMLELERKFENMLDNFSEDVAQEVEREQSHLMLMQDQVDKQRELLTKQLNDVHKKMAQEEQQRANSQRILQDTNQQLRELIEQQAQELQQMHIKLSHIENGTSSSGSWLSQLTSGVLGMFTVCGTTPGGYQSAPGHGSHETRTHIPAGINA